MLQSGWRASARFYQFRPGPRTLRTAMITCAPAPGEFACGDVAQPAVGAGDDDGTASLLGHAFDVPVGRHVA